MPSFRLASVRSTHGKHRACAETLPAITPVRVEASGAERFGGRRATRLSATGWRSPALDRPGVKPVGRCVETKTDMPARVRERQGQGH